MGKLKVRKPPTDKPGDEMEEDDDEEDTDNILSKIMAEVKLEERLSPLDPEDHPSSSRRQPEPEELPWCVICNGTRVSDVMIVTETCIVGIVLKNIVEVIGQKNLLGDNYIVILYINTV